VAHCAAPLRVHTLLIVVSRSGYRRYEQHRPHRLVFALAGGPSSKSTVT
jgi:hypothetical protein